MDDSTIGQPSEELTHDRLSGLTRRQVGVAAAWALPVIAAATAAPMAAASFDINSSLSVVSGSEITVSSNTPGGTVSGSFGGAATITNTGGSSSIDFAEAIYQIEGPVDSQFMMFGATTLTTGSPATIVDGAYTWTVTAFGNYVILDLLSPLPVAVPGGGASTVINVPVLSYSNTLTGVAVLPPPPGQQVRASLSFTVKDSTQGQLQDGNFKLYPSS